MTGNIPASTFKRAAGCDAATRVAGPGHGKCLKPLLYNDSFEFREAGMTFRAPHRCQMRSSTRPWIMAAAAAALLSANWACKKDVSQQDETLPVLSAISVGRPRAERQLLDGFWYVENNAWRWTRHNFSVKLMPPPDAAQKGAALDFRFTLPDSVISRRKSVTLSVSAGNVPLPPETYTASGDYSYKAPVPATAFKAGEPVKIAFSTDKFLAAGEVDARELGLVAKSFALVPNK